MTMIERMARAICLSLAATPETLDTMMAMRGDDFREAAHAALATMREPNEAVLESDAPGDDADHGKAWTKMIEAAGSDRE